jgi:glycosyltransferase involved in cell wall biosynthesis
MSLQFSVIIPVYNNPIGLGKCLQSLLDTDNNNFIHEIIVIDNGSVPPFKLGCQFFQNTKIILLNETKVGSYAARNKGIAFAKSDYLAFVDSDCLPKEDWLRNAQILFSIKEAERICGNIEFSFLSEIPNIYELFDSKFNLQQKKHFHKQSSVTANLLIKKSVIKKVGFFNDALLSGADIDWGLRASNANIRIHFGEKCTVIHPARNQLSHLLSKKRRVAAGFYQSKPKLTIMRKLTQSICPPLPSIILNRGKDNFSFTTSIKLYLLMYRLKLETFQQLFLMCLKLRTAPRD